MCVHGHWGALLSHSSQSIVCPRVRLDLFVTWDDWVSPLTLEFVVIVMRAAEHGALILCSRSLPHDSTYFVWEDFLQLLSTQAAGLQLLPGLLSGLTLHQSFGLGQEVGQQDLQPRQTHTHTHVQIQCSVWCAEDVSMVSVCWTPTCWHINKCLSDSDAIFNIFSPCFCLRGFCVFYLSWLLWWTNMWHLRKITQKSVFRSKITC